MVGWSGTRAASVEPGSTMICLEDEPLASAEYCISVVISECFIHMFDVKGPTPRIAVFVGTAMW